MVTCPEISNRDLVQVGCWSKNHCFAHLGASHSFAVESGQMITCALATVGHSTLEIDGLPPIKDLEVRVPLYHCSTVPLYHQLSSSDDHVRGSGNSGIRSAAA